MNIATTSSDIIVNYKLIVLIISSHNIDAYSELRSIGKIYLKLYPNIKFLYLEYRHQEIEMVEEDDYLYLNGDESFITGIYNKSIKAIEYINQKYNYDFILRTNLSSFLNLDNILTYLDTVPTLGFAGGYMPQGFMSGTGIFMSRDVGNILVSDQDNSNSGDDIVISNVLSRNGINLIDITDYKLGFLTSSDESRLPNNCYFINMGEFNPNIIYPSNILYFRIRNEINRNIDIQYFILLLQRIYNIKYSSIEQSNDTIEQSNDTIEQSNDTIEQSNDTIEQSNDTNCVVYPLAKSIELVRQIITKKLNIQTKIYNIKMNASKKNKK
jgi:hypothetical protein